MTTDTLLQNTENQQQNPLHQPVINEKRKYIFTNSLKTFILVILLCITFVLLPISIISSTIRKNAPPGNAHVSPTPIVITTPTATPPNRIPEEIQEKINQIDALIGTRPQLDPPQLDENIGL